VAAAAAALLWQRLQVLHACFFFAALVARDLLPPHFIVYSFVAFSLKLFTRGQAAQELRD
jgi:hypothetical protein